MGTRAHKISYLGLSVTSQACLTKINLTYIIYLKFTAVSLIVFPSLKETCMTFFGFVCVSVLSLLFPTRLLTSEDEYKWYCHQMIYFSETINTVSTLNTITLTRSLVLSQLCTPLTLCMLASWSHEGAVFLDLLSSSHFITSSLFPYLGSTDAPCSRLGVPVPPSPKWRPHSQGLRTLPYRDPEHLWYNKTNKTLEWFHFYSWIRRDILNFIHSAITR